MNSTITELYQPRAVSDLGNWNIEGYQFKVYGIAFKERDITESIVADAHAFVRDEVPALITAEGDANGLGFVIIHSGELGATFLAHWWVQGSILCQHIRRKVWGAEKAISTTIRPVIACVWELGLINAEQEIWRKTMMNAAANPSAYLNARADVAFV